MIKFYALLEKELNRNGGTKKFVDVPKDRQPTVSSLKKLDMEIAAQISTNDAVRSRSMLNASRTSLR